MSKPKSENIVWSKSQISSADRAHLLGHKPATLWFTGLSGSGKSTLAIASEIAFNQRRVNAYTLDGDNIRHGLNSNLGFSPEDRSENIRRIGEVCRLFHDAGNIVFSAFISPYREDRHQIRKIHPPGGFIEVFVDTPLEVCEQRDVKGLYKKARAGEIAEFTGISAPYEAPRKPEITIKTEQMSVDEGVDKIIDYLFENGYVQGYKTVASHA